MRQDLLSSNNLYEYKEQDPAYMGEPFDPTLANGPSEDRKCRDVLFLILYLAFWAGLIVVAIVAFSRGHPHLLAAPFDSSGLQCGYSHGYEKYPYGFYNINNFSQFACISSCPETASQVVSLACINGNVTFNCADYGSYATIRVVGLCYPTNETISEKINVGIGFFDESIADLKSTWPISLSMFFMTLIMSMILLFAVRACGGCIVVTVIFLYFAVLVAFGVVCLETANNKIQVPGLDKLQDPELLRIISYISFGISGLSLLIMLCCIRKIKIGIMVIKTTA